MEPGSPGGGTGAGLGGGSIHITASGAVTIDGFLSVDGGYATSGGGGGSGGAVFIEADIIKGYGTISARGGDGASDGGGGGGGRVTMKRIRQDLPFEGRVVADGGSAGNN